MVDDKEDSFVSLMLLTSLFLLMGRCLLGLCPVVDLLHCWWLSLNSACCLEFLAVFWVHCRHRKAFVGVIQCCWLSKSVIDSFWDCSFTGSGVEALAVKAVELLVGLLVDLKSQTVVDPGHLQV